MRISPFDSGKRRHTSFASVEVYPQVESRLEVKIEEKDIRVDTYRASGAGGQHVNRTDSAIRLTHYPTGIVVQCQNSRSQHRNRAQARKMLEARLYELSERKVLDDKQKNYGKLEDIGWGHQIRSYVFHPYTMVKDLRTHYENRNGKAVLDGKIDGFLEAYLLSLVSP